MTTDLWTHFRELSVALSVKGINLVERQEVGLLRFQTPDQLGLGEVNAFSGVIPNILDLFSGTQALAFVHVIFKGGVSALCTITWSEDAKIEVHVWGASSKKFLAELSDYINKVAWPQFVQAIVTSHPGVTEFTRVNSGLAF